MLTENAASSECPLHGLVGLVLLVAADDAVFHVVVFEHEAKQFESMPTLAAAIAEICTTSAARHVVAAFRSLNVDLI